ncbi:FmdB family zinc ribbon protein [Microlunatus capsulatus]|uniref:FmdB family regulatory protein n=1 Tax=Microlunatus capsulatus TaxID=99117 RepID=A0ABS4ZAF1_9ACTN|nr:FmdB family zinc ribbon protein [Microlunatus capsulatus]MBP2418031.1 putative FmdB family regulatory protein [Microlunatus capsulatus]
MPTYQYRCTECGHDLEAVQKFTDAALTECPNCGGSLRKVFNAVGVVFKGSGFYRTDSRKAPSEGGSSDGGSSKPAPAKEKAAPSGSGDSGSGSGSGSGSSGSAPAKESSSGGSSSSSSSSSSTGSKAASS